MPNSAQLEFGFTFVARPATVPEVWGTPALPGGSQLSQRATEETEQAVVSFASEFRDALPCSFRPPIMQSWRNGELAILK